MTIAIVTQVNAFTDRMDGGNPAGVCLLKQTVSEEWMLHVAKEMNLSETAFLWEQEHGYRLRWFTPVTEVPLCGHATLASAHVLWEKGYVPKSRTIDFDTKSGRLIASRKNHWIQLDFPALQLETCPDMPFPLQTFFTGVPVLFLGKTDTDYIAELPSEEAVKNFNPNFYWLEQLEDKLDLVITSRSDKEGIDFVSRCFAPNSGIGEDPVTGSIHCALASYWETKLKKSSFSAEQLSERGGFLKITVAGDRVYLQGQAICVRECIL